MFQQFHVDTLGNRFIKSLLAQTPIPKFEAVSDGDNLVKGCYYVYKNYIIKCHCSGVLRVSPAEDLYPSPILYPSVFLLPGYGYTIARFYVISLTAEYSPQTHTTHHSTTNYYDSDTHIYLGRYLRYLKASTGLNLFPFYNVFPDKYFNDIELYVTKQHTVGIVRRAKQTHKVCAVPILVGKTYRIFVDAPEGLLLRACMHPRTGFVEEDTSNFSSETLQILMSSGKQISHSSFSNPIEFRIESADLRTVDAQRNLYLAIQLSSDNDSALVVLEDVDTSNVITCDEHSVRLPHLVNLSLIRVNTRISYAFSNRLLEYLLGNVVSAYDPIPNNVRKVQDALCTDDTHYAVSFTSGRNSKGTWDSNIPLKILDIVESSNNTDLMYDHDGNVNKDVEKLLLQKGVTY